MVWIMQYKDLCDAVVLLAFHTALTVSGILFIIRMSRSDVLSLIREVHKDRMEEIAKEETKVE